MKKLWFPLMLLFILLNVSACNAEQECPVEVQVETRTEKFSSYTSTSYDVIITSVADSVTITNVIVNRGNLKPAWTAENWTWEPVTLAFGKRAPVYSFGLPPKEIEVQTDMGNWTFRT